jgi:hypothetical protein
MRRARLRWTEKGREKFVRMSATIHVGGGTSSDGDGALLDEVVDVDVLDVDVLGL